MKDKNIVLEDLDRKIKKIECPNQNKYNVGKLEAFIFCKNSILQYEEDSINYIKFMIQCLKDKKNLEDKLKLSDISKEWISGYIDALEMILNKL